MRSGIILSTLLLASSASAQYVPVKTGDKRVDAELHRVSVSLNRQSLLTGGTSYGSLHVDGRLSADSLDGTLAAGDVAAGSLGSGVIASSITLSAISHIFVGAFSFFVSQSSSCPSGWLRADGSQVSSTTYSALYAKFGTLYGSGSNTFALPDMNNGEFVRAVSTSTTSGWALSSGQGALQTDALQGHKHGMTLTASGEGGALTGHGWSARSDVFGTYTNYTDAALSDDGTNGTPRTATETRPKNYAMVPCIFAGL